jgi:creatinine amidohydrolase/Fe(II)-dependent formamide hydrolase-like protein
MMLVLEEIVEGLRAQGFRKQVLAVGHGSSMWTGAVVKHVNRRFGDVVVTRAAWLAGTKCTVARDTVPWGSTWRQGP